MNVSSDPPSLRLVTSTPNAGTDLYGDPMLLTAPLDREEAYVLFRFHKAARDKAASLARLAEYEHHTRRVEVFATALGPIDPLLNDGEIPA